MAPSLAGQRLGFPRRRSSPAGLGTLATESLDVVLFRGDTSAYMSPASGAATLNVMRLMRPELPLDLLPIVDACEPPVERRDATA